MWIMNEAQLRPEFREGDIVYDTTWESHSDVLEATDERVVLQPETWHGQPNTAGVTTEHTPTELHDATHLHHRPAGRGIVEGERAEVLALELAQNVEGVGQATADALMDELSVKLLKQACKAVHERGNAEWFEDVNGVGPATAERIATYLLEDR